MPLLPVHAKSTRIPLAEFYFFAIITIASFFYAYLDTSYSTDGDVSYPDINQGIYNSSSPYLTIATMPFRVNSMKVVNELLTSISSWLRLDDSIVVHLYDIVGGMGNQSDLLINKLQEIWGSDRVFVRGTIVREMHAETIPQIFEQVEREAKSPLVAYINNDMILDPDFMKYLRSTATFFGKYNNWSFHVSRTNLNNTCRELVNYSVIQSPDWPEKFSEIKEKYFEKTQVYGYDVFLWNRLGISMKKAKIPKFLIGRPFFEYSVIAGIKRQGWFITGFPTLLSFHISHPGRLSFQFKKNTSDFIYCEKLHLKSRDMSVRNIDINLRINETYVTIFHKPRDILPNTTFTTFPVQHYLVNPLLYLDKKLF